MKKINQEGFQIVYSLGQTCACAKALIRNNLRTRSGPFDWLAGAGFAKRCEIICDHFSHFLDKEDMQFIPKDDSAPEIDRHCDYYSNTRTKLIHLHDFPADTPIEQSYPQVHAKYRRRIARFEKDLQKHDRILLVWFGVYQRMNSAEEIITACQKICKKYGKPIHFLIIEHEEDESQHGYFRLAGNIEHFVLPALAWDDQGNMLWHGKIEALDPIFSRYRLCTNAVRKQKKRRWLARILTAFLPLRRWRHRIREKLMG